MIMLKKTVVYFIMDDEIGNLILVKIYYIHPLGLTTRLLANWAERPYPYYHFVPWQNVDTQQPLP